MLQEWRWQRFADLNNLELYAILAQRQRVFAVEQNIIYLDPDDQDQHAWHLSCWQSLAVDQGPSLVAYARAFAPGTKFATEAAFGRVLTAAAARGQGLGKSLVTKVIERIESQFHHPPIRISAQAYLEKFYRDFGFQTLGAAYIEEGLPHLEMLRPPH